MLRNMLYGLMVVSTLSFPATADQIEVIQLNNRPADRVLPLVRPLLRPGETATGTGFKLIVRASPQTLADIRRILSQIDGRLKNVLILVRHGNTTQSEHSEASASVRYHSEIGTSVSGHARQDSASDESNVSQRVRVLEGNPALIHAGRDVVIPGIYGGSVHQSGAGFYVTPRINGDRVNLEISPYRETPTGRRHTTQVQRASTVVSGQVGEWIYLGGSDTQDSRSHRGILSGSKASHVGQTGISVKVNIVD